MGLPSLKSSVFFLYCKVDLGSVLITLLSNSTKLGSTDQAGCESVSAWNKHSFEQDLRVVWHFMMSVMGDAVDVDGAGIYWLIPQGKDCFAA